MHINNHHYHALSFLLLQLATLCINQSTCFYESTQEMEFWNELFNYKLWKLPCQGMQWSGTNLHSTNLYKLVKKPNGHLIKNSKFSMTKSPLW